MRKFRLREELAREAIVAADCKSISLRGVTAFFTDGAWSIKEDEQDPSGQWCGDGQAPATIEGVKYQLAVAVTAGGRTLQRRHTREEREDASRYGEPEASPAF